MELLTFTIAAGETKRFERAGRYFEIIDAPAELSVIFDDDSGAQVERMVSALSGFYMLGVFRAFTVTNPTAAAQVVRLMVTGGQGGSRRQPGLVRVVDAEREKVLANQVFAASFSLAGAAGPPVVQVWNPAGSGKVLSVYSLRVSTLVADTFTFGITTTQLATLVGQGKSLLSGGVDASAQRRTDSTGVALLGLQAFIADYIGATAPTEPAIKRPVIIQPGFGVYIAAATAGAGQVLRASIGFEELSQ